MKKRKNTFITGVIFLISAILGFQIFSSAFGGVDRDSYVELVRGEGYLGEQLLSVGDQQKVVLGEKIRTGDDSLATITWGDGSLTRIGENSELVVDKSFVSSDVSTLDIAFTLYSGKTWSKVVSFISEGSSFTQSFDDIEAGVRGTVFDVDMENNYLRVSDHEVELKNSVGELFTLGQGEVFDIQKFTEIDLSEFLQKLEDAAWTELNTNFDSQYVQDLTKHLEENFELQNPFLFILEYFSPKYRLLYALDTAESFDEVQAQLDKIETTKYEKIYDGVFARYQKLNFVEANNYEFYKRKVFYKKALVYLSENPKQKQQLLRTSVYDLKDILGNSGSGGLQETLEFLNDNAEFIEDLDLSFLDSGFDLLPQGLKESFKSNFKNLQNMFKFSELGTDSLGDNAKDTLQDVDASIKNFLDENVGGFLEGLKN